MQYLIHLKGQTGETVNLTVFDGGDAVFVSRIVGSHVLSTGVIIGTRLPAYASAGGLAVMSALSQQDIKRLLAAMDLRPFTPTTVYEPAGIRERRGRRSSRRTGA